MDIINYNAISFTFCSSSGAGGQNVNRRSTKAELRAIVDDLGLRPDSLIRLKQLAYNRINKQGELVLQSEQHRTQGGNKQECLNKFHDLLNKANRPSKKRIKTRPNETARERRLRNKKKVSLKKKQRAWQP